VIEDLSDPRRIEPPYVLDEREMLEAWLEFHRTTLLLKCEGLDDAGRKRRPVPTSKLSLHGLVRHAAEGERNWFRRNLLRDGLVPFIWRDPAVEDTEFFPLDDADWAPTSLSGGSSVNPYRVFRKGRCTSWNASRASESGYGEPPTAQHAKDAVLIALGCLAGAVVVLAAGLAASPLDNHANNLAYRSIPADVLPACSAVDARGVAERIRSQLAFALSRGAVPEFTDERGEDVPQLHVLSFAMGRP
jgi:hypothetical protein